MRNVDREHSRYLLKELSRELLEEPLEEVEREASTKAYLIDS